ncbi:MAG: CPA1 family monovalent cation:H+ antiporter [Halobacteriales archaeon]|jgi:CPA1 family monovalent cation:H+ antiporter
MVTGVETSLIDVLAVFIIAAGVGVFVAKVGRFPYTIALLVAGFAASLAGVTLDIELTHDVIFLVLLPPLLFQGAATTDIEYFRRNLSAILLMAVVGLGISITVVALGVHYALGYAPLVALLFATIVLPTDPVSVLAIFEELGVPDRLAVLVEGESLLNDGVGVVIYAALLELILAGTTVEGVTIDTAVDLFVGIFISSTGGAIVGLLAGYSVYRVMINLDEHMTEIVLTIVLAYGSFLLAEHYVSRFLGGFHFSGVIATVVAGLFIGNRGAEYAMSPRTKLSVFNTWETAAFIVNTFIFVLIGVKTPLRQIIGTADLLLFAIALVLVGRAVAVYPLATIFSRVTQRDISVEYQHVLVWGGLHGSIPIALVLGLPATLESGVPFPHREQLRVLVFGIAAFSLVVQGLSMGRLIDRLGIVTTSDEERLYQLLVGRARAVDAALEAAEELSDEGRISQDVAERFEREYGTEKEDLNEAISELLSQYPEIRDRERIVGERQVLTRERSAVRTAERDGLISTEVAEGLLDELDLKLDQVRGGESTVSHMHEEEGYEEFWRHRAEEQGLIEGKGDSEETRE